MEQVIIEQAEQVEQPQLIGIVPATSGWVPPILRENQLVKVG